ncbi:hypothetical protein ACJZ2D_009509 [Fusarium nematophilum]
MHASYAKAAGANGQVQNGTVFQLQSNAKSHRTIKYNKNGDRLDPDFKNPPGHDTPAQLTFKRKRSRAKNLQFCFDHYLKGKCPSGTKCHNEHRTKLTDDELAILRYLARGSKCNRGPPCRDFDCQRSHHCPWGPRCTLGYGCKFDRHLTGEELKPARRLLEGKAASEPI